MRRQNGFVRSAEGLGMTKGTTAKIYVVSHQPPKLFKPMSVPYALERKVEEERTGHISADEVD